MRLAFLIPTIIKTRSARPQALIGFITIFVRRGFFSQRTVPADFGVLLTSHNINTPRSRIRAEREQYHQTHPQDIAEIEALAREVAKTKHCNSNRK